MAHDYVAAPEESSNEQVCVKSIVIVFFDVKGIVNYEFVPPGQTVNAKFYKEALQRLNHKVTHVRKEI